jgi:peptidoglycan/LPS O-acetylase OafA/YrhL
VTAPAVVPAATSTPGSTSLVYRPELDGIRGLAILLVIAQHINLPSTTLAGMVGVNLFFALSGYLITGILLAEIRSTGRVDIRRFYARRIRRLVPALVAVVVATGLLMAAQGKLVEYLGPAGVSLFYVSDIAKAAGYDLGYVGHTWSLAMEEQFYLLWPAILLFLPRRFLVPAVLAGIAAAVALQVVVVGFQDNVLAHFRPDVRADAILWGCLVALVPVRIPRWAAVGAAVGLLALSVTFVWPYAIALSSVLSAVVVAGAASVAAPLSWRPLVRVGEISYGLYLWHAIPVGLFMERTVAGDVLAMVAVVLITFGLALLSERWIEKPFRKPRSTVNPTIGEPKLAAA